jgi:hypothetical protein
MNKNLYAIFAILILSIVTVLIINSVDNKLTEDDYEYIPKILNSKLNISKESSYEQELEFINSIQKTILKVVPSNGSIPKNMPREAKDLFYRGEGGCSERARLLSKIFKYYGFKTRQFSMYSKKISDSSIRVLLTSNRLSDQLMGNQPRVRSHAAIEVLTKKGWLVVDPNEPWIAVDTANNPLSISKIQNDVDNSVYIDWRQPPFDNIYVDSFVYVFGLYSRHGRFYPPYNFIPDINYVELIQNVL